MFWMFLMIITIFMAKVKSIIHVFRLSFAIVSAFPEKQKFSHLSVFITQSLSHPPSITKVFSAIFFWWFRWKIDNLHHRPTPSLLPTKVPVVVYKWMPFSRVSFFLLFSTFNIHFLPLPCDYYANVLLANQQTECFSHTLQVIA